MGKYFEVTAALGKYFEDTAALGKYFEALPFSNFQKQMVSGSKLKCPSKVSWEVSFSLYYTVIYGNCLGNVVIGMEKCGKMCENGEKMWKNVKNVLETRFYYTTNRFSFDPSGDEVRLLWSTRDEVFVINAFGLCQKALLRIYVGLVSRKCAMEWLTLRLSWFQDL